MKKYLIMGAFALVLLAVGGPAGVASYHHAQEVAKKYGESEPMSAWLPLTTDGMLVAVLALVYWRRFVGERVGVFPWVAFAAGFLATMGANLASADMTFGGIAVALWPPLCFALTLELGAMMLKSIARTSVTPVVSETTDVPEEKQDHDPLTVADIVKQHEDEQIPMTNLSRRQEATEWARNNWPVTGPQIVEKFGYALPTAYAIRKDAEKAKVNGKKRS